jgi:hypothetical protein
MTTQTSFEQSLIPLLSSALGPAPLDDSSDEMVTCELNAIEGLINVLTEQIPTPIRYFVEEILRYSPTKRQSLSFDNYSYILTKSVKTAPIPVINFRRFSQLNQSDGIYNWMLCMYKNTVGIYYKQVVPMLRFSAPHDGMAKDICVGNANGLVPLAKGEIITILAAGQFRATTDASGLKTIRMNLQTHSAKLSIFLFPIDSPHLNPFIEGMFRLLGPDPSLAHITYVAELESLSYIPEDPTLIEVRQMLRVYSSLYGYTVYEFDTTRHGDLDAYERTTELSCAYYYARVAMNRRVLAGLMNIIKQSASSEDPELINKMIGRYVHTEIVYTADLAMIRPLDSRQLARYVLR